MTPTQTTIVEIKEWLEKPRHFVQVTTYTRSTVYSNPDDFRISKSGGIYVRRGRNWDLIATANVGLLVGLRFGRTTDE